MPPISDDAISDSAISDLPSTEDEDGAGPPGLLLLGVG